MSHVLLSVCEQVATINLVRRQELCVISTLRALITRLRNRAALIYDVTVELYLKYYRDYVISDVSFPQQLLPVIRREG